MSRQDGRGAKHCHIRRIFRKRLGGPTDVSHRDAPRLTMVPKHHFRQSYSGNVFKGLADQATELGLNCSYPVTGPTCRGKPSRARNRRRRRASCAALGLRDPAWQKTCGGFSVSQRLSQHACPRSFLLRTLTRQKSPPLGPGLLLEGKQRLEVPRGSGSDTGTIGSFSGNKPWAFWGSMWRLSTLPE